jgi:hypothetical protein
MVLEASSFATLVQGVPPNKQKKKKFTGRNSLWQTFEILFIVARFGSKRDTKSVQWNGEMRVAKNLATQSGSERSLNYQWN